MTMFTIFPLTKRVARKAADAVFFFDDEEMESR